jgi:hypothetical protein
MKMKLTEKAISTTSMRTLFLMMTVMTGGEGSDGISLI